LKTSHRKQSELFLASFLLLAVAAAAQPPRPAAPRSVIGTAVYYNDNMNGRNVAMKGEKYDRNALTAATHGTFPLGSTVRVTNLTNRKSVIVKVNDRMSPRSKQTIDLSRRAAETLGMIRAGHARVRIEMVSSPPRVPGRR
jgi:rare lipoprotein A